MNSSNNQSEPSLLKSAESCRYENSFQSGEREGGELGSVCVQLMALLLLTRAQIRLINLSSSTMLHVSPVFELIVILSNFFKLAIEEPI